jgi:hypothetical protein
VLLLLALGCAPDDPPGKAPGGARDDTGLADSGDADSGDTDADSGDTDADSGDTDADSGDTDADSGDTDTGGTAPDAVPDFALNDLNRASPRFGEAISPRDYLERVSGWYFIHAT